MKILDASVLPTVAQNIFVSLIAVYVLVITPLLIVLAIRNNNKKALSDAAKAEQSDVQAEPQPEEVTEEPEGSEL